MNPKLKKVLKVVAGTILLGAAGYSAYRVYVENKPPISTRYTMVGSATPNRSGSARIEDSVAQKS